jgi:hypothetical protein
MRTKPSFITRTILAAAAAGSIATGIAVPLIATAAPAATSVVAAKPGTVYYGG